MRKKRGEEVTDACPPGTATRRDAAQPSEEQPGPGASAAGRAVGSTLLPGCTARATGSLRGGSTSFTEHPCASGVNTRQLLQPPPAPGASHQETNVSNF